MNHYNNPHSMPGFQQGPMMSPQPGFIQPGMQQPHYQNHPPQGGYVQQGYPQPRQAYHPQQQAYQQVPQGTQIVDTNNGPFYMDVNTRQLIGPVNQPPMVQRATAASAFQHSQVVQQPQYQNNRYGNQQLPQRSPEYSVTDNRYGNIQQLTGQQARERTPMTAPVYQTPTPQPSPVVKANPVVSDDNRNLPGLKAFKHFSMPIMDTDIRIQTGSLVGGSLCHVVNTLIDEAHSKPKDRMVWIQQAILLRKFYDTTVKDSEAELFQSDSEVLFKALRQKLTQVEHRGDAAYFHTYNDWLTDTVKDYLYHASNGDISIDSFAEDYEEICKGLEGIDAELHASMLQHMTEVLTQATTDVLATREVVEPTDTDAGHTSDDTVAVVPERVTLVYMKLLSTEFGDDGTLEGNKVATRIISNLKESVDEDVFYLVTLDRKFYKVFMLKNGTVDMRHLYN